MLSFLIFSGGSKGDIGKKRVKVFACSITYFTHYSDVIFIDFEQVNACWGDQLFTLVQLITCSEKFTTFPHKSLR